MTDFPFRDDDVLVNPDIVSIRRLEQIRCFVTDGNRLILPSFGAYTGGLDVLDRAFAFLFSDPFHAWMIGQDRVYPVASRKLG